MFIAGNAGSRLRSLIIMRNWLALWCSMGFAAPAVTKWPGLLTIDTEKDFSTHPKLGASWEGFAMETTVRSLGLNTQELFFWGTHSGAELDLFWQAKGKNWGAEFKYGDAPKLTKSMQSALKDLKLAHLWVVYPGDKKYSITSKITVVPLKTIQFSQRKILV